MLRIDRLVLKNYRCFKDYEIDFHPQVTVLTARNGQGKTAILDALGLSLTPLLASFPEVVGQHITPDDVYLDNQELSVEALYPCRVEVWGQIRDRGDVWSRELRSHKGRTSNRGAWSLKTLAYDIQANVQEQADEPLPLIAHYGTDRLWNSIKLTTNKRTANLRQSRLAGYVDCLNPASNFKWVQDWLGLKLMDYHQASEAGVLEESTVLERQLKWMSHSIRDFLSPVLPVEGLKYSWQRQELDIITQKRRMAIENLSDGTRIVLGLVADLTHRAIRLNPHLNNPMKETPGIVLIDEVDLHLHPEWQQQLVGQLHQAFPLLQFILTSHSEQIISTVTREQVRLLDITQPKATLPEAETYAGRSNQVLERVFSVDSRPPLPIVDKLNSYLELVQNNQGTTPQAGKLRKELDSALGEDDPDLLRADAIIARQRITRGQSA